MSLARRTWTRMNGAGNSFFVTDARENPPAENAAARAEFARRLCAGTPGLQADGLFLLQQADGLDFEWDFYNSDGSAAEMCGNAARCATRFFLDRVRAQAEVRFRTAAGVIEGARAGDGVYRVRMPEIPAAGAERALTVDGRAESRYFVNTGVPHLVVPEAPDADRALKLRRAPELGAAGANVTFVEKLGDDRYRAVTFERGVDDFTPACGTGATAAAAYARTLAPSARVFAVQMPGGLLTVEWTGERQAYLSGPAVIDFDVKLGE